MLTNVSLGNPKQSRIVELRKKYRAIEFNLAEADVMHSS